MERNKGVKILKAMILALFSSFSGAFIGAGWSAYSAVQLGVEGHSWLPFSIVGALAACGLMLAFSRSFFGNRGFN